MPRVPPLGAVDVDAVVFDLGGVLVDFGGVEPMRELSGIDSDDELWRRWLTCEHVRRFERGLCDPDEFAADLIKDWQLPISPDEFLDAFRGWPIGPLAGAMELVHDVRAATTTACLSNTNQAQWDASIERWSMHTLFDRAYLSFDLGMVKPDREIFEHALTDLDLSPQRVLYLDDNAINVEAARDVGLRAVRVIGVEQARAAVVAAGVLAA
ncbi:MAG: HAD family phosphatase [Frankiales bacterium]|nr:HAD family phosphatase [Frankiales bacterium]